MPISSVSQASQRALCCARMLLMRGILDGRDAGRDRRGVDVERAADAVDGVDDVRRAVHPAKPQRGETVDLRERAAHHDVFRRGDKLDAGFVVVALDVFGIGGVEHKQHVRRQPVMQPLDLVERNVGSGRIVGIGQKHDLGLLRHCGEHGVDIGGVILLRRDDRLRAGAERRDRINQKSVRGVDRLVAVGEIRARQQVQQIVGARAAHDAIRIEAERAPDRFAQLAGRAIRIILKVRADGLVGRDRLRARPERRLVRRQLEHLRDARRAALARHIGLDIEHAGSRLGTHGRHCELLFFLASRKRGGD